MTTLLTIAADPAAPVACDMTDAEDTLAERMAEYRRLFDHALLGRASTDTASTFTLAIRPGVQEWLLDLVRRKAACCPFLSYDVELEGDQISWTTTGLSASDIAALDEFLTGHDMTPTSSLGIAQRLEQRGGIPVIVPATEA